MNLWWELCSLMDEISLSEEENQILWIFAMMCNLFTAVINHKGYPEIC